MKKTQKIKNEKLRKYLEDNGKFSVIFRERDCFIGEISPVGWCWWGGDCFGYYITDNGDIVAEYLEYGQEWVTVTFPAEYFKEGENFTCWDYFGKEEKREILALIKKEREDEDF